MPYSNKGLRLDLRTLMLMLSALTALVMLVTSFFASYHVQRQLLIDNAQQSNQVYASKLASITDIYLHNALQQLAYSANLQVSRFADPVLMQAETERLLRQTNSFNSTFVIDAEGVVRATSPSMPWAVGKTLDTDGARQALIERRPLVSRPYMSAASNLVVALSQPVFDAEGRYLGYVGGSIYLHQSNVLNRLLGEHYYRDGSYLYVVDSDRRLLYHPDEGRVGSIVEQSGLLDMLATQDTGTLRTANSRGDVLLAGYATVASVGWGIVSQRPLKQTVAPLNHLMLNVLIISAPLILVGCLFIWWLALTIARPLWQLAASAHELDQPGTAERIGEVRSWYFEAAELKRALLLGLNLLHERIGKLKRDVQTDPLTGLNNRRGVQPMLAIWQAEGLPFSAIALDIDHFKRINDSHGHHIGDTVLQKLADLMRGSSRGGDVLCRTGGEEFLMLLPGTAMEAATAVAERLRQSVEQVDFPGVGRITLSLGVAHWHPGSRQEPADVLKAADRQLYLAKAGGRNRVSVEPGPAAGLPG
ncbi:sensor domain-containing diguanylate cyclase [Phytopseudomonas dryadis]|uniref:diguanylate cyclase n=1 Tax=Phytopseudomonas dryadis TaxID=2487520 RepID=A0A4Q9R3D1_9GAMM|nr:MULTISPECIES: sensor domain-containing diguanylate cyclase [Pseudomonas]TBU94410.1 diguanylate cyclase [Pseudomonas dryadis]TBU99558.1 diguanylate cyclase [Pseudomonas dryadis]TBV12655.1 diguanylate cyclase [Pseudomonas sp. FRB 230]